MNVENQLQGPAQDRLIDRLVDGELGDIDRRALLLRLEKEPDGWRRCALAFLESQSWRSALGSPDAQDDTLAPQPGTLFRRPGKLKAWQCVAGLAALAASVAAAFALGWLAHDTPAHNMSRTTIGEESKVTHGTPSDPPATAADGIAASRDRPAATAESGTALEPVVKRWEQRGYRAESQKRSVSVALKDGRKVDVPVREVRFQYVGGRTY
jgi:hypothetical protein